MAPDATALDNDRAPGQQRGRGRRDIDWRAIEREHRAASMSLRELAEKQGCSHSTIANFAGRHGWTRNPLPRSMAEGEG